MAHRPRTILVLPNVTIFFAGVAKLIGAFGLVAGGFTNAYHTSRLGQTFELATFTKYYHRDQGLTIDSDL